MAGALREGSRVVLGLNESPSEKEGKSGTSFSTEDSSAAPQ